MGGRAGRRAVPTRDTTAARTATAEVEVTLEATAGVTAVEEAAAAVMGEEEAVGEEEEMAAAEAEGAERAAPFSTSYKDLYTFLDIHRSALNPLYRATARERCQEDGRRERRGER